MKISFKEVVEAGSKFKPFWGFSYWEEETRMAVCYPIPINWIVAVCRNIYWKFMIAPDIKTRELQTKYYEGYTNGYSSGKAKSEKGQSLVEFAISLVFILLLLSGIFEFGVIFFQFVQLRDAVQEGAQYGSYCQDPVEIEATAKGESNTPLNLWNSNINFAVEYEGGVPIEGSGIKVSMTYPHKIVMPFMSKIIGQYININASVTDTILRVHPEKCRK